MTTKLPPLMGNGKYAFIPQYVFLYESSQRTCTTITKGDNLCG